MKAEQDRTPVKIALITSAVCRHFGVSMSDILPRRGSQTIYVPRQVVYYLAREMTAYSLPRIGRVLARDHKSILEGKRSIERRLRADQQLASDVSALRAELCREAA